MRCPRRAARARAASPAGAPARRRGGRAAPLPERGPRCGEWQADHHPTPPFRQSGIASIPQSKGPGRPAASQGRQVCSSHSSRLFGAQQGCGWVQQTRPGPRTLDAGVSVLLQGTPLQARTVAAVLAALASRDTGSARPHARCVRGPAAVGVLDASCRHQRHGRTGSRGVHELFLPACCAPGDW